MKCLFYSFKGGSGRTTSLVNAAYQLTKFGKSTLIIDFDFDAPGFSLFTDLRKVLFNIDIKFKELFESKDIISVKNIFKENEYNLSEISTIEDLGTRLDPSENSWRIVDEDNDHHFYAIEKGDNISVEYDHKGILEYIYNSLKFPQKQANLKDYIYQAELKDKNKYDGSFYIMKVSRGKDLGDLKAHIETRRDSILKKNILSELISKIGHMDDPPEYILIDSRPGRDYIVILETDGLKLREGEPIVVCSNYNKKVVEATSSAILDIKNHLEKEFYIKGQIYQPLLIQRPVGLVRPDIDGRIRIVEDRVLELEPFKTTSSYQNNEPVIIDQYIDMLFDYLIADEKHIACPDYKKLARRIIEFNEEDITNKIDNAKKGNITEIISKFETLKRDPKYLEHYRLYFEFGKTLFDSSEYDYASRELESAFKQSEKKEKGIKVWHPDIALLLGKTYYKLYHDERKNGYIKNDYIKKVVEWFKKAEELGCSSEYELYLEWSKALIEYSKALSATDGLEKLENAAIIIEKAINSEDLRAGSFETMETKGEILLEKAALIKDDLKIIEMLNQSNKALETSDIRGGEFKTHHLWAKNLYNLALLNTNVDKRKKNLKEADEHFESASRYQKEDIDANYFWGLSLALLAKYNSGDKQRNLLIKASEKLSTAANIKKGNQKINFYLGAVLFMLEQFVDESQKTLYFRDGFYNMEWTVSIHHKFSDFYFKAEDIQRIKNTYEFVRTLEKYYGYEPLFEEWVVGETNTSKEYEDLLKKAIQDHRDTIKEVI